MSPGDFEDQIKAGIKSSDYLVLVMTPSAMRSPSVEKEWRYAREKGRCIVPIKPTFEVRGDGAGVRGAPRPFADLDAEDPDL